MQNNMKQLVPEWELADRLTDVSVACDTEVPATQSAPH